MSGTFIRVEGENEDKLVMATLAHQLDLALGMLARGGLDQQQLKPGPLKLGVWQIEQVRDLLRAQAGPGTKTTITRVE